MSPEAQRIAIATACGKNPYRWFFYYGHENGSDRSDLYESVKEAGEARCLYHDTAPVKRMVFTPDYPNSLDDMHEAEKVLSNSQVEDYSRQLQLILDSRCRTCDFATYPSDYAWHATAAQRAEAFLKCLGLWQPVPSHERSAGEK
jgi:hypothetical protein